MENNEENQESDDLTYYKLQFSLDDDGFFRRGCSNCGLHFKVMADAEQLGYILSPAFKQIEEEYDLILSTHEDEQDIDKSIILRCPYCGQENDSQNMVTDEFSYYFLRWAERELVYPKIRALFKGIDRTVQSMPRARSSDLFSLELRFEHDELSIPIRPISGPELPDMVCVNLNCCQETIKIAEGWLDKINCPFCSSELILI